MLKRIYYNNKQIMDKLLFAVAFAVAVYVFATFLLPLFAPFALAFIISAILYPLVHLLKRYCKIPRGLSAAVLIVVLILSVILLISFVTTKIASQAVALAENLPSYIASVNGLIDRLAVGVPADIADVLFARSSDMLLSLAASLSSGAGRGGMNFILGLPSAIIFTIITIISSFFFLKDRILIENTFKKIVPANVLRVLTLIRHSIGAALWGYVKAQLVIMVIAGGVSLVGLAILRYPYAFLVSLLIALVDALPGIGTGAVFWPWGLYALLAGEYHFAAGLMIIYVIVFVCRQILEPKILSSQIGIHPLLILVSLYVGIKLFGALGILLGPILAVSFKVIWTEDFRHVSEADGGQ